MNPPVPWYRSHAFTALWQSALLTALGFALSGLVSNTWDWKGGLAIPVLSNLLVALKVMWSPTVQGPLSVMNRSNVATVPPSSIPRNP